MASIACLSVLGEKNYLTIENSGSLFYKSKWEICTTEEHSSILIQSNTNMLFELDNMSEIE